MHLNHPQTITRHPHHPAPVPGKTIFHKTQPWGQKGWGPLVYGMAEGVVNRVWMIFTGTSKPVTMLGPRSLFALACMNMSAQSLWAHSLCGQRHFRVSSLEMEGVQSTSSVTRSWRSAGMNGMQPGSFPNPMLWLHLRKAGISRCACVCGGWEVNRERQTWSGSPARGNRQSRLSLHLRWTMAVSETGLDGLVEHSEWSFDFLIH